MGDLAADGGGQVLFKVARLRFPSGVSTVWGLGIRGLRGLGA